MKLLVDDTSTASREARSLRAHITAEFADTSPD
jgi:hypothetical protein